MLEKFIDINLRRKVSLVESPHYANWETPLELLWYCLYRAIDTGAIDNDTKPPNGFVVHELTADATPIKEIKPLFTKYMRQGDVFLQLGSGLGLSCIYAVNLGASRAMGVEMFPERVEMAYELLNNPEIALGGKNSSGLFQILEEDSKKYPADIVEGYNRCLEKAVIELKTMTRKISYRVGNFLEGVHEATEVDFIYIGASPREWECHEHNPEGVRKKEKRMKALAKVFENAKIGSIVVAPGLPDFCGLKKLGVENAYDGGGFFGGTETHIGIYKI